METQLTQLRQHLRSKDKLCSVLVALQATLWPLIACLLTALPVGLPVPLASTIMCRSAFCAVFGFGLSRKAQGVMPGFTM